MLLYEVDLDMTVFDLFGSLQIFKSFIFFIEKRAFEM